MKPNKFYFSIGGFMGQSFELSTNEKANELTLATYERGYESKQTSTTEINADWWNQLESLLDDLNGWQWEKEYKEDSIMDGTDWEIRLRTNGKALVSSGLNAYPNEPPFPYAPIDDEPSDFDRLLAFLSKTEGQEIE